MNVRFRWSPTLLRRCSPAADSLGQSGEYCRQPAESSLHRWLCRHPGDGGAGAAPHVAAAPRHAAADRRRRHGGRRQPDREPGRAERQPCHHAARHGGDHAARSRPRPSQRGRHRRAPAGQRRRLLLGGGSRANDEQRLWPRPAAAAGIGAAAGDRDGAAAGAAVRRDGGEHPEHGVGLLHLRRALHRDVSQRLVQRLLLLGRALRARVLQPGPAAAQPDAQAVLDQRLYRRSGQGADGDHRRTGSAAPSRSISRCRPSPDT